MPPVSKKQARLFRAAAAGRTKVGGMSREKAKEMVEGHPTRGLPESKSEGETFKRAAARRRGRRR